MSTTTASKAVNSGGKLIIKTEWGEKTTVTPRDSIEVSLRPYYPKRLEPQDPFLSLELQLQPPPSIAKPSQGEKLQNGTCETRKVGVS